MSAVRLEAGNRAIVENSSTRERTVYTAPPMVRTAVDEDRELRQVRAALQMPANAVNRNAMESGGV